MLKCGGGRREKLTIEYIAHGGQPIMDLHHVQVRPTPRPYWLTGESFSSNNPEGVVGSQVVMDPTLICKKTRRLRGKLADICKKEPALLKEISKGVSQGSKECQYQFRSRRYHDQEKIASTPYRWNRTLNLKLIYSSPTTSLVLTDSSQLTANSRNVDTRETGFVNAITAAGVTYAVTRACTMGDLVECSCDKTVKGRSRLGSMSPEHAAITNAADGDWEWGGCGDNVNFGYRKSKDFMDAPYRRRSDIKTLVRLHNNDAGRLAVKSFMRTECKCHGLSGSCTLRTCWRKMPPFRDVGNRLKERFDGAAKVIPSNDGHSFIPEGPTIKPPGRGDLVYSEDSPDFCKANRKTGSLGTQGRQCNATSPGVEGCELLCCGRGFDTRQVREKFNCKCRFKWCCEVTCSTCTEKRAINTCR
uniref:Protein Wnt n=4 Tax=Timema TaxID=61471 RepID=A0A7R9ANH0_TIMSH|nr:unnamed protein product [Timema shepardi]